MKNMKKAIMILAALMLVVSGVAAVSAYEAHIVNVEAKVENAAKLLGDVTPGPDYCMDFGTVFPEMWLTKSVYLTSSDSFCMQSAFTEIKYKLFAELKPDLLDVDGSDPTVVLKSYSWPGDATDQFMYIGVDPTLGGAGGTFPLATNLSQIGPPPAAGAATLIWPTEITFDKDNSTNPVVWIGIDGPVFDGYYNSVTDAIVNPVTKPSGLTAPSWVAPLSWVTGTYVGFELKFQVSGINP